MTLSSLPVPRTIAEGQRRAKLNVYEKREYIRGAVERSGSSLHTWLASVRALVLIATSQRFMRYSCNFLASADVP